jgi:hypothetical protein
MTIAERILRTEHEIAVLEEEIAFWEANLRAKSVLAMSVEHDRQP